MQDINIGGIVGFLRMSNASVTKLSDCYNAGHVSGASPIGSVVGVKAPAVTVTHCYYDKQMSPIGGISGGDVTDSAMGLSTSEMTAGTALNSNWDTAVWNFTSSLYPRLIVFDGTDASLLSAIPVYLFDAETADTVVSDFMVNTTNGVAWYGDSNYISISGTNATVLKMGGELFLKAVYNNASKSVYLLLPTYEIMTIEDQKLTDLSDAYVSSDREIKNITIANTGTEALTNLSVTLSGEDASAFLITQPASSTLSRNGQATFTISAVDGLALGNYSATVTVRADNMTDVSFTITQNVNSYSIETIQNQTLTNLTEGYTSASQESRNFTINSTGTGDLENLQVTLSGTGASSFTLTPPSQGTLTTSSAATTFAVTAKDNLLAGGHSATVTISADHMDDAVFTITQNVYSYSIDLIDDQTMTEVTEGYPSGSQESKKVTITNIGNGTLNHVQVDLSGAHASAFEFTQANITTLTTTSPAATFVLVAKDDLTVGIYNALVTISADNMSDASFNVLQTVNAIPDTTSPLLSSGSSTRSSNTGATVTFTSNENGSYYYGIVNDGDDVPVLTTTGAGVSVNAGTVTINATGLTTGAKDIYIKFKDTSGNLSEMLKIDIAAYTTSRSSNHSSRRSSDDSDSRDTSESTSGTNYITLNGSKVADVTQKTIVNQGETTTTQTLHMTDLTAHLDGSGRNSEVKMTFDANEDVAVTALNGQLLKNMEDRSTTLSIERGDVIYSIPAAQFDISKISDALNHPTNLQDIDVSISISSLLDEEMKLIDAQMDAQGYQFLVKPVSFTITASYGSKSVEVKNFSHYVERSFEMEEGTDVKAITTGVEILEDGSIHHIPTSLTLENGRVAVHIHSLHNSTYSVIYNEKTFDDLEGHWSQKLVSDMASRLVISGTTDSTFEPDRKMTRAEFTTVLIRALGLMNGTEVRSDFEDISETDWYYQAVAIAEERGLIQGNGTAFDPNDDITREEAMTIMAKAYEMITSELGEIDARMLETVFTDSDTIDDWASASVVLCIDKGIVSGYDDGTVRASNTITRAESTAMIYNLLHETALIN